MLGEATRLYELYNIILGGLDGGPIGDGTVVKTKDLIEKIVGVIIVHIVASKYSQSH